MRFFFLPSILNCKKKKIKNIPHKPQTDIKHLNATEVIRQSREEHGTAVKPRDGGDYGLKMDKKKWSVRKFDGKRLKQSHDDPSGLKCPHYSFVSQSCQE